MALVKLPNGAIINKEAIISVEPITRHIEGEPYSWEVIVTIKVDKHLKPISISCNSKDEMEKILGDVTTILGL